MDESSQNIVKFIATGTGAILLLMAAYYYARVPEPVAPVAEKVAEPVEPAPKAAAPVKESAYDTEFVIEEEITPIDGKPADPATVE